MGQCIEMLSISTIRLCKRIFWCKNWTVFCLAWILHVHAVASVGCWFWLFPVRSFHVEIRCAEVRFYWPSLKKNRNGLESNFSFFNFKSRDLFGPNECNNVSALR